MNTVYLALGSNLGDSSNYIKQAVRLLSFELHDIKQAPIYVSKAVGYTDQPDFFNTAIAGQTGLKPEALLDYIKEVERKIGRVETFRNGPREIDIDIIFYGNLVVNTDRLTVPHPNFSQRDFVLRPLYDLDPSLVDPSSGQTIKNLLDGISPKQKSIINRVDQKP